MTLSALKKSSHTGRSKGIWMLCLLNPLGPSFWDVAHSPGRICHSRSPGRGGNTRMGGHVAGTDHVLLCTPQGVHCITGDGKRAVRNWKLPLHLPSARTLTSPTTPLAHLGSGERVGSHRSHPSGPLWLQEGASLWAVCA